MFSPAEYELIDFGGGRKLERFGQHLIDRPSPGTESERRRFPELWPQAAARYERTGGERGVWVQPSGNTSELPQSWRIRHQRIVLELKATPAGHLGVFPEQAPNWDWLTGQIAAAAPPVKVLNLFAYTGASTLTAAAAGAEVTHVDAARNTVAWARRNAELSSLSEAPIRWIAEDAPTFVRRELKRGSHYDVVLLDPPSYGRGGKGKSWKLDDDLVALLADCVRLLAPERRCLLLSCHTPGYGPRELGEMVARAAGPTAINCGELCLVTRGGRTLASGSLAGIATFGVRP